MPTELGTDPVTNKGGRPKKPEPTRPLQLRLPLSWIIALERMANDNRRTRTQEAMLGIEDRLKGQGYLPDDASEEGSEEAE